MQFPVPFLSLVSVAALGSAALEAAEAVRLSIEPPDETGWIRINGMGTPDSVCRLEASLDLADWSEIARVHGGVFRLPDPASSILPRRYYRSQQGPLGPEDDWKNQVQIPVDPFLSSQPNLEDQDLRWMKFAIMLEDPTRVYFQHSKKYLFHYDFAVERLAPFAGMTPREFEEVSLQWGRQQVVLGSVLLPPNTNVTEWAIEFVGRDPYPPERVAGWFDLVRATVAAPPGFVPYYFPTFAQAAETQKHLDFFNARGVAVGSADRWIVSDHCYAPGWALGPLRFVSGEEIDAAYTEGRLDHANILLTDAVPAEVPPLAGIIVLTPATPNSHVAILANSFGIPFAYFADAEAQARLLSWEDQDVGLRAASEGGVCTVLAASLEGQLSPELREELLALKTVPPLDLPPKAMAGVISLSVENLGPADIQFVGGKAANLGLLRRAIPEHSPPAIAFTFDLWDGFLDQTLPGGQTLRSAIQERLGGYVYPPVMAALKTDLGLVRALFTDVADFSPGQKTAILAALAGFDANRKIRFRSSSNVEDGERFSGAGLYDSYSGCLADDLDGDEAGPSHCDPEEGRERGVFRAMRKVYASFYNDNAFLERLRYGVDEAQVGMGLLVHHSFPDEIELANGVATFRVDQPGSTARNARGELVTQLGAVSVANPQPEVRPERVKFRLNRFGLSLDPIERSSLVQLGGHVLGWQSEYRDLMDLLNPAALAYEALFPEKQSLTLDFEYKKIDPDRLVVKQIRELPRPKPPSLAAPYLLNERAAYEVFQSDQSQLFAHHRLKSFWALPTRNLQLTPANLDSSLYARLEVEYLDIARPGTESLEGDPATFPGAEHETSAEATIDRWSLGDGAGRRTFALRTSLEPRPGTPKGPVLFLSDFLLDFEVTYASPQPAMTSPTTFGTTTRDFVRLALVTQVSTTSYPQHREGSYQNLRIETDFFFPPPVAGVGVETFPLQAWAQTTLTGLASQPIVLRSPFSQTYQPGRHNIWELFLFEPQLEPGLDPAILEELEAANIRAVIWLRNDDVGSRPFTLWGLDDTFRTW